MQREKVAPQQAITVRGAMILESDACVALRLLPSGLFRSRVTSPPYWSLRDHSMAGQIGSGE